MNAQPGKPIRNPATQIHTQLVGASASHSTTPATAQMTMPPIASGDIGGSSGLTVLSRSLGAWASCVTARGYRLGRSLRDRVHWSTVAALAQSAERFTRNE